MDASLLIRDATPADRAALGPLGADLVARHHAFDPQRFIPANVDTPAHYGAFLVSELSRTDAVVLVAERNGEVVGYAYGALEGAEWLTLRGPAGVIYDLSVAAEHQRAGIGRRLLQAAIDRLADLGAPQLQLSAAARNEGAQRLFATLGFRPTMVEMTRERDS